MEKRETKKKPKNFDWYNFEAEKDDLLMYVNPIWPDGTKSEDKINDDEIKRELEKTFEEDKEKGFIRIKEITNRRITVSFKIMKWLRENFLEDDPKITYKFPRTLEWKWRKSIPLIVLKKVPWIEIGKILEKKFKEFLKENQKRLFKEKFKILDKVHYDSWFIYEADLDNHKFIVKMKISIMMTLAKAGSLGIKVLK